MKKLLKSKLRRKKQTTPSRITNDTVAEHRERIIAGGKRYKYPLQYTRRKLISNTVIIAAITLAVMLVLGWWQLYIMQNSSAFFYRITRLAPVPVASVDGESARYSDYLLNYRASEHYLKRYDEIRPDSDDGRLQLQYKRREALDIALADAFARRIAREHGLGVSDQEVNEVTEGLRSAANGVLSAETSSVSLQRVLGLSDEDLSLLVRNSLLRAKAAFAIDEQASQMRQTVADAIKKHNNDLEKASLKLNDARKDSVQYGASGLVNTSVSVGGISARQIAEMKVGEVTSTPIQSVTSDGYYFVKLLQKNDTQVNFAFIRIPLTEFNQRLRQLKDDGKINEYITIRIDQPQGKQPSSEEE